MSIPDGIIQTVSLTNPRGYQVKGTYSSDKRSWTIAEPLAYDRRYIWSGSAIGKNKRTSKITGSFVTVKPVTMVSAKFEYIHDGGMVGVGAPVIVQFHGPVYNKSAAERTFAVTTTPKTEGSWSWQPPNEIGSVVHWRPAHYWQPGTKVSVELDVYGADYGGGGYGKEDVSLHFTVGRAQITTADMQTHRIVTKRNGIPVFDFPASYGLESDPRRITPVGTYVTLEKYLTTNFNNPRFNYYNEKVHWATRLSNNGVFVHAYDKTLLDQGVRNVSHGCINLSTPNAKAFFGSTLYGDPVEVSDPGHRAPTVGPDDGNVYDWSVPYAEWKLGSALH